MFVAVVEVLEVLMVLVFAVVVVTVVNERAEKPDKRRLDPCTDPIDMRTTFHDQLNFPSSPSPSQPKPPPEDALTTSNSPSGVCNGSRPVLLPSARCGPILRHEIDSTSRGP